MDKKIVHVRQITEQLLSCTEKSVLWICWHNGQVAVGRGEYVGYNIIMAYEEMNPFRLTALSVTTDGASGTWQFAINEKQGELFVYNNATRTIDEYSHTDTRLLYCLHHSYAHGVKCIPCQFPLANPYLRGFRCN